MTNQNSGGRKASVMKTEQSVRNSHDSNIADIKDFLDEGTPAKKIELGGTMRENISVEVPVRYQTQIT